MCQSLCQAYYTVRANILIKQLKDVFLYEQY